MCFGGKKSSPAPVQQQPTTKFEYVSADNSNSQQRQAAVKSATNGQQPASFGSELGAGGGAQIATDGMATGGIV